ncbi:hypothetical protein ACFU99_10880 [Streptomyces sp. NPDC057654]|uniref:hypothetical protein n=1 Tax=Streptomyces sp. NPDC057654 TaxID=3346196 RepID=UPI0036B1CE68
MALQVGAKALKASRARLRQGGDRLDAVGDTPTACLLLFYAAECGMKERLLTRGGHRDSAALDYQHDLRRMAKDLKMPRDMADRLDKLQSCRLQQALGTIAMADLHQAWRYGAKLDIEDEKAVHAALCELISWCEQD